jgi:hypothetical protein
MAAAWGACARTESLVLYKPKKSGEMLTFNNQKGKNRRCGKTAPERTPYKPDMHPA